MSSGQHPPGERIHAACLDHAVDYDWVDVEASQNNVSTLAFWPAHITVRPVRIAVSMQTRVTR